MHRSMLTLAAMFMIAICAGAGLAADPQPAKPAAPSAQEMAIFSVPKLMDGTLLRDLAKALSAQAGVLTAQADAEKGTFNVTFDPKKTNPDVILKTVTAVAKDAKLVSVGPADPKAGAHDCGKCPSAKKCPGAQKT